MQGKNTPVELSGGAGFNFEDKVAAYYMACMLSGPTPLGNEFGHVIKIDFQTEESGWLLDDLIITLSNNEITRKLAISIKRDKQLKQSGFPKDFVKRVWKQWDNGAPFYKDRDILGLAIGDIANKVETAWNDLQSIALETSADRFLLKTSERGSFSKTNI
jgi:hypothetical protein